MKQKKNLWKKMTAGLVACSMGLGTWAGILTGGISFSTLLSIPVLAEESEKAMGRYLETDVVLPEGLRIEKLATMEDERLQIIGTESDKTISLWQSSDGGDTWERTGTFPQEYKGTYFLSLALAPEGGGAAVGMMDKNSEDVQEQDSNEYEYCFLSFDEEGNIRETLLSEEMMEAPSSLIFTQDGELAAKHFAGNVAMLDPDTGEVLTEIAEVPCDVFGVCGKELLLLTDGEVQRYDYTSGEPCPRDDVLNEALYAEGQSYFQMTTSGYPIAFAQDGENRLYYCSNAGIFSHVMDGSVVELVVDGTLTSISSPGFVFNSMAVQDQSFYVAYADSATGTSGMMKYEYAADVPSVPERELTIYSLQENDGIRQAIVQFQKRYPDTYVNYETGITGADGVTASDALRRLNTEILAGDGPDILIMDDMSVETYAEKGILMDLMDLVGEIRQSDGLLENIAGAFQMGDVLPAVPAKFSMQVAAGVPEVLDQIDSIAALEELAQEQGMFSAFDVMSLPEILYPVCAGSWKKEDNTIDQEKLSEFVTGLKNIYDNYLESASEMNKETLQAYAGYSLWGEMPSLVQDSISASILTLFTGEAKAVMGAMGNLGYSYTGVTSVNRENGNCEVSLLSLQQSNVFLPSCVLGILNTSGEQERAVQFLKHMLSKEGQGFGEGFPVNKAAFEEMLINDDPDEQGGFSISSSDRDGNMVSLDFTWPTEEEIASFREMVEQLSVCADTERVQKEVVIEELHRCMNGEISAEEAVNSIIQKINLYLAE